LALLELYKRGRISLDQGDTFGELEISWTAGDRVMSAVGAGEGVEEYDG
jgi:chromatin segregation and condensation protein Rec8/ScpA/Scc1 (kleisin family)